MRRLLAATSTMYQNKHDKWTYILLNQHFINTTRNFNMFQPLKGNPQGV